MIYSMPDPAPKEKVIMALEKLGFRVVRQGTHIAMTSYTSSGYQLPLTIPDMLSFKASMLRTILSRAGIAKNDFLEAYYKDK